MNSYSRETLRAGWHQTANGPYGSSRGNRVLQSKRVHGPSAQTLLCIAVWHESCSKCGIEPGTVSVTVNGTIQRYCVQCHSPSAISFLDDDGEGMCPLSLRARW